MLDAELVAPANDAFLPLYAELYHRHIVARLTPTPQQRVDAWRNYERLFERALAEPLALPPQWLWDICDEFVYQFQSCAQFRAKLPQHRSGVASVEPLRESPDAWSAQGVIGLLARLAAQGADPLGSFAVIGLSRVFTLLGDYGAALRVLGHVDLQRKGVYAQVTACHVTLYYYLGFCYLMLRRHVDAVKTFASVLAFMGRAKAHKSRSFQADQTAKKIDQLYALLAIAITLCPQRVDEHVHAALREKYADKMPRLQQGDPDAVEELFLFACPRFVAACPPPFPGDEDQAATAAAGNPVLEPMRRQLHVFLREVEQQRMLPTIRSYLRLYTSIPIAKLAAFLGQQQDIEAVRRSLICYRHKAPAGEVDFFIDGDMVHIRDSKPPRKFAEYFLRSIARLQSLNA